MCAREFAPIPERGIGEKDVIAVPTDDDKDMAPLVPIGRETNNDWLAGIGDRDNLVK
ncbi:MAG TPA: hypothetical protein VGU68_14155 [Ktedonobacteraceae bacterium]|nr:hypothetical protein [Ktedonobacteraceae bacterium]